MRIELEGHDEVPVGTGPHAVADALADPDELLHLLDGMLRPSSTRERWVLSEITAGPMRMNPAVAVRVLRAGDRQVVLVGRPVAGHTPAHLDLTLVVHPADHDDASTVASRWDVSVDVPGPQLLAATIQPLLAGSSRSVTRRLADRLRGRFGPPHG